MVTNEASASAVADKSDRLSATDDQAKRAWFETDMADDRLVLRPVGDWRVPNLALVDSDLRAYAETTLNKELIIEMDRVSHLDTSGAMMIQRTFQTCEGRTHRSSIVGAQEKHERLLRQVVDHLEPCEVSRPPLGPYGTLMFFVQEVGKTGYDFVENSGELLNFIGETLSKSARVLVNPSRLRLTPMVYHMEETGLNAMPIIGLMSFLVGAVVAFMGAKILAQFNAQVFVVEMVGIGVLREFGVLIAAILTAGRSGSSFTAQIGSMKIREEIDALRVLGLDPVEVLIIPRVFALVLILPILAFFAAVLGMIGGALIALATMDISLAYFVARTQEMVAINNLWAGLIKAPFFAFVIAVIGCFQGMEVEGSAESLGQRTTLSVVQALFLVIVIDAFFAMFYLEIDF